MSRSARDPADLERLIADLANEVAELKRRAVIVRDWHAIGDPGEPAFQNGWANYGNVGGTAWARARFYRDYSGTVHLSGRLTNPAVTGGNSLMFTLPEGFRPPSDVLMPTYSEQNGAVQFSWLWVAWTGEVRGGVLAGATSVPKYHIDGISFRVGGTD